MSRNDDGRRAGWDGATRTIGGKPISTVGMGCNSMGTRLDRAASIDLLRTAVDSGITFFDTADVYGMGVSETVLGEALGPVRDRVVIATKFGGVMTGEPAGSGGSPAWVRTAAEASLRRLDTDHIDLLYLHRPDPEVATEDTLAALAELVDEGKVLATGISKADEDLIRTSRLASSPGYDFVQNEYSLLDRSAERGELGSCIELGLGFVPYFPLASGALTGRYSSAESLPETARLATSPQLRDRYLNAETAPIVAALAGMSRRSGIDMAQLAIAWLLARPGVTSVIAGATTPAQLASNAAAGDIVLSADVVEEIDRLTASRV